MNIWKVLTIIFLLVIVGLGIYLQSETKKEVQVGDFHIGKESFNSLVENVDVEQPVIICDMKEDKCLRFIVD